MARRKKTDSIAGQVEIFSHADNPFAPPDHIELTEFELPFWYSIIDARCKADWNGVDLENAATLARLKAKVEELGRLGEETKLIADLTTKIIALSKSLHVHAAATQGRSRDTGERAKKEKEILGNSKRSKFLAQPKVQ